ncbi:hypothetical protein BHL31_27845 [Bacillus cereus]|nr:hypothetical protein BHL31_27845 [Bacillus cereus]
MVFIYFSYTSTRTFFQKKLQCYFFVTKNSQFVTSFTKNINIQLLTYFFVIKREQLLMNCTPIVRHSLTIGGAVFLWLNLQLMKKYKSFYVI